MPWTRPDKRNPDAWLDRPVPKAVILALLAGFVIGVGLTLLTGPAQASIEARAFTQTDASRQSQMRPAYRNCADARAHGAAPVRRGDPGYGPHLDRDNDGVGCEPYYRR